MTGLPGKIALVTGAGGQRSIGRSVALELARRGADVVLTDARLPPTERPPAEVRGGWQGIESVATEVRSLGRQALTVHCDLGSAEELRAMVEEVLQRAGRVDVLVNNARAVMGRDKVPIVELDEEVWQHFLAINTTAVFRLIKHVGAAMIRRGAGGRIVNMGSDMGKRALPSGAAYATTKFAVIGLTQAAALDLAPHRITVNCVCPGPVNTGRLSHWERAQAEQAGIPLEEFRGRVVAEAARAHPLGRIAEPEDVAHLVAFLASDEAAFITGQAYNVNGGLLFH